MMEVVRRSADIGIETENRLLHFTLVFSYGAEVGWVPKRRAIGVSFH